MKQPRKNRPGTDTFSLDGHLLIAMPSIDDERFARSVIYICSHSTDGAMGLIINKRAEHIDFGELLERLELTGDPDAPVTGGISGDFANLAVLIGGPVDGGRGFVLHSSDYHAKDATLVVNSDVSLTATTDILKAIASGNGPDRALMALGYSGWAPGQLEAEIGANGWLHCEGDPDLVFEIDPDQRYNRALRKLGINPSHLVSDAGHA